MNGVDKHRNLILALEDDQNRLALMREAIASLVQGFELRHWDNSFSMRTEAPEYFPRTCLISLDCDLGDSSGSSSFIGPGDGMDAVLFLNQFNPFCPIIVHTSGLKASDLMVRALRMRGWSVAQAPFTCRENAHDWGSTAVALIGSQGVGSDK